MKRILLLSSICAIVFVGAACAPASTQIQTEGVVEMPAPIDLAREEASTGEAVEPMISAVIMPHHELAKELIESAWEEGLKVEPDLIVLIGPDHPGLADHPLIWTRETESQVYFACSEIAEKWIRDGVGGEASDADHSVETPLKFLTKTGNEIPVLAVTLPRGMETEQVNRVVEAILETSVDRLLLVGSVDFSHGLTSEASKKKDAASIQWIQARDLDAIQNAGNEFFDSPETIEVLLRCSSGEIESIDRCDSSDFGWGKDLPGTSYQVIHLAQ